MALVARPIPVSTAPNVVANRPVASARNSSMPVNTVDSVTPSSNSTLGEDVFSSIVNSGEHGYNDNNSYSNQNGGGFENRGGNENTRRAPPIGIINSTTENFAKLLELRDVPILQGNSGDITSNGLPTLNIVARAVSIYETTVNILSTDQNVRGETLSYTV